MLHQSCFQNKWLVFKVTIRHCTAILGRGQPGLMRWIWLWIKESITMIYHHIITYYKSSTTMECTLTCTINENNTSFLFKPPHPHNMTAKSTAFPTLKYCHAMLLFISQISKNPYQIRSCTHFDSTTKYTSIKSAPKPEFSETASS